MSESKEKQPLLKIDDLHVSFLTYAGKVQAVRGLCGGFAWSGGPCGALSGGVCFLSLLARELGAEERIKLIGEYHEWFKARTAQYGGENCENIERGDPQNMLTICPGVIMDSYEKCVELLEERGLA